jgi:3-keto-5-aminohexanoate cleavage enzyme
MKKDMKQIDWSRYKDCPPIYFQQFGKLTMDLADHIPWSVPKKVAIVVAPTGAFFYRSQNPNQPYSVDDIIQQSIECVEAGACSVHVHVRDENGLPTGDKTLTKKVVKALRDRFGANVHLDGEALWGRNFEEMMEPIVEDFYESAGVNCHAAFMGDTASYLAPQTCVATAEVLQAYGKKPLLAVYNPGDIDNTYRWLIKPGIVKPPFVWGIVPGMPGGSPMWDPLGMVETVIHTIRRIKDIDKAEHPCIMVGAAGRASSYLTTLALMLGLNVRVGMEDTIYTSPLNDDVIVSNRDVVARTVAIAALLGREPMTAAEYRAAAGMRAM